MSMIKTVHPGDQNFNEPLAQVVKIASRGLRGADLTEMVKRAGMKYADVIRSLEFAPGEIPIHLIGLGATEFYGPNRNGDGFTEACCRKYYDTFTKHAFFYRNHENKDPRKSYGIVKHAMYNEPMHRIELIIALNGTKEAAERNGGLLADVELAMLEKKAEIPVSMACKVAYDVCSICGNKAKTRDDYCRSVEEGGDCPGGGCFTKLGQVLRDGRMQYVDNPHPTWFDMSRVWKPADRIAYVLGPFSKAAAAGGIDLAPLVLEDGYKNATEPWWLRVDGISDARVRSYMKLAGDLATLETKLGENVGSNSLAFTSAVQPSFNIGSVNEEDVPNLLRALANEKIAMPLSAFVKIFYEAHPVKAAQLTARANQLLPGIYNRLVNQPEYLEELLTKQAYKYDAAPRGTGWSDMATKLAADYSLEKHYTDRRCQLAVIRGVDVHSIAFGHEFVKEASSDVVANEVAANYAIYKLAFLNTIKDKDEDFHLTCMLALRQNRVYEATTA